MVSVHVPARICFFGDHQDYLGLPVIAGTIDRFISIKAVPNASNVFHIHFKDMDTARTIAIQKEVSIKKGDYLHAALAVLRTKGLEFENGYDIEVHGNIPINAGLSSSSALLVAWIRFLVQIQVQKKEVSDFEIGHWAYEIEVLYFGEPGGLMDQYTIAQRGLLFIATDSGRSERLTSDLGILVVAESGISKKTLSVLKNARIFAERAIAQVKIEYSGFDIHTAELTDYETYLPSVSQKYQNHWYAAVHNYDITKKAKQLLQMAQPDLKTLGELMNAHQNILQECIQNTPKTMISMMKAAREAGAYGAKIIGSGGGGCMVALVPKSKKENVISAFLKSGAKAAYEVKITE